MKNIIAQFRFPDSSEVIATAQFATLPGQSPITWTGNTRPIIDALPDFDLPQVAYASGFEDAMRHLAQLSSATIKIETEGDWEVFQE